jgi:hypothetical protein
MEQRVQWSMARKRRGNYGVDNIMRRLGGTYEKVGAIHWDIKWIRFASTEALRSAFPGPAGAVLRCSGSCTFLQTSSSQPVAVCYDSTIMI